jgi:23S rRNA (cytosine1962-C5)-methyltransferase
MSEPGYQLVDFGDGRRLERFGPVLTDRPAPQAEPPRQNPAAWEQADAIYDEANRTWHWRSAPREAWLLTLDGITVELRPTPTGQVGLFPEQQPNWRWISTVSARAVPHNALNAFGYTGASTLALASATSNPAGVCHVDASRPAVAWARRNAEISNLREAPIRWIVDDVLKFLEREDRRGRRYDGFILDPPAFGRGKGRATWKLERDLPRLMGAAAKLAADEFAFVCLSAHAPGLAADDLAEALAPLNIPESEIERLELSIRSKHGGKLACGVCARWARE